MGRSLRWRRALVVGAATVALAVVGLAGSAAAQVYPPTAGCGVQLSASLVDPGDVIAVSGTGATPGQTLTLVLESTPVHLGTVTADATGSFTTQATIPAGTAPGAHTVRVQGSAGCSAYLEVARPATALRPAGRSSGALAFTGWNLSVLALSGLLAVTLGAVLVAGKRRLVSQRARRVAPLLLRPKIRLTD